MSDLPPGWAPSTLEQVATWSSGGTPKAGDPQYYADGTIPWAVIGDLNESVVLETASSITQEGLNNSSAKVVPIGTVLVAMYGSIGKLGLAGRPMATNQAIACGVTNAAVMNRYLLWWLRCERLALVGAGKGGAQSNISQSVLKPWPIPIAPLNEQRRIVDELERRLSHVDAAVSGFLSARKRLATARIAVLASALLEDGTDGSWSSSRLDAVAEVRLGRQRSPKNHSGGNMRPYLRAANVGWSGLKLDDVKEMNFTDAELAVYRLQEGDIVLSEASGSPGEVGKPALWRGEIKDCCSQNTLIRVRCGDTITPEFVLFRLRLEALLGTWASSAGGLARGVGIHHLGASRLAGWPISFPVALDRQRALVAQAERQLSLIDAAERALDVSLTKAAQLRRSLLAAAFAGRLVSQNPDDEPASVLLDRITATRAAAAPTKPTRRKKKDVPA